MSQEAQVAWWRPTAPIETGRVGGTVAPSRDHTLPFVAVLVFTVLLFLAPQATLPGFGRVRLALIMGVVALASHSWTHVIEGRPLLRLTKEMWIALSLLAWTLVTLPLSMWLPGSMQILFGEYLKSLAVFWLLSNTVTTLGRLRAVAWGLSLMAAPVAATGLRNFLSGHTVAGRIVGFDAPLLTDPNGLAVVLNLILPLTVGLCLVSRQLLVRTLLIGLTALDVGAIVATFSRGGFLVLATTCILYLRAFQKWGRWKLVLVALALLVAAIPLVPSQYVERLGTISRIQADRTGSAQERWELMTAGIEYALGHPLLGAGIGMNVIGFCLLNRWSGLAAADCGRVCYQIPTLSGMRQTEEQFFNNAFPSCLFVHNTYLEYAMDLGWIGLGLFLWLLVSCERKAARVRDRCAGRPALSDLAALAEATRVGIVAFGVAALFYPWAYTVYFFYAAGLAVAVGFISEAEERRVTGMAISAKTG